MDIELLSNMLRELIIDNESVSLHGIGAFVSTDMPSVFSDRGFSILPPYRKINFLSGPGDGDELLVKMYSEANDVSLDQAKAIVHHYLSELKNVLSDRKSIAFPGLGRLRMTRQSSMIFIQDEDASVYPDGFGLAAVSLKSHVPLELHQLSELVKEPVAVSGASAISSEPEKESALDNEQEVLEKNEDPAMTQASEMCDSNVAETEKPESSYRKVRKASKWWIWPVVIAGVTAFALALFLILAQTAPDFIDSLLYTPEELRILNW